MSRILISMKFLAKLALCFLPFLACYAGHYEDLLKKAQSGDAAAQNELGEYLASGGHGEIQVNHEYAAIWWQEAIKNGSIRALTNYGCALYVGSGVPRNEPQAITYWTEAAKRGDPEAQYFLGSAYCNGLGVMRDYPTAVFWWDRSAKQGNHRAQNNLAFAYAKGQGVDKDLKKAFSLWKEWGKMNFVSMEHT